MLISKVSQTIINYTYDPLNRLTEANYSIGDYYHYTYDPVGNRLTQETLIGSVPLTTNYVYDAANRLTSVDSVAYTWDNNGNLLNDGVNTYAYDSANRLKTIVNQQSSIVNQYNGFGDRLQETVNGDTTTFTMDLNPSTSLRAGSGLTRALSDGTNTYHYGIGIISQTQGSGTDYFLDDALGSVRQLTDASGEITYATAYDPFGVVRQTVGNASTAYGYTGEYTSNDLVYLRARHYAPAMGRFFTRDPFAGNVAYPASLNPYTYGYNNPVRYTDPSGNCVEPATFVFVCLPLLLAFTAGGADLYYQLDRNNGNMDCVDWGEVAMYAGGAAAAGLLIGVSVYALAVLPDWAIDLASLTHNLSIGNYAASRWDVVSLMVPGLTGLGALSHSDDALRALNRADNAYDALRASEYSTIAYRSSDEIFSGFSRAFPKQSEQAAKLMEDAAKASNIELNRFVDRVIFDPARDAPYFRVTNGERIIGIDVKSLRETHEMQLLIGSHELAHAEQFNHILLRQFDNDFPSAEKFWNSPYYSRLNFPNGYANYYKREAVAERLALSRLKMKLENLSAEVIGRGNLYIKRSRFNYRNILP